MIKGGCIQSRGRKKQRMELKAVESWKDERQTDGTESYLSVFSYLLVLYYIYNISYPPPNN